MQWRAFRRYAHLFYYPLETDIFKFFFPFLSHGWFLPRNKFSVLIALIIHCNTSTFMWTASVMAETSVIRDGCRENTNNEEYTGDTQDTAFTPTA